MKRIHLFEFEDLPWFPSMIRGYMTDYLNFTASLSTIPFQSFSRKLHQWMRASEQTKIVDLCSGGGGPLPQVLKLLRENEQTVVQAVMTDFFPNGSAFKRISQNHPEITADLRSVDATQVPQDLVGFRTIFNGFHHFHPEMAKKILKNAAESKQGIAIYELVGRSPFAFFSVATLLVAMPLATPFMKPFRLSRIFFTYFVPLVPIFTLWDGLVSCLRVYSPEELQEMTDSIKMDGYIWEVGKLPFAVGPGYGTYLLGRPNNLLPKSN